MSPPLPICCCRLSHPPPPCATRILFHLAAAAAGDPARGWRHPSRCLSAHLIRPAAVHSPTGEGPPTHPAIHPAAVQLCPSPSPTAAPFPHPPPPALDPPEWCWVGVPGVRCCVYTELIEWVIAAFPPSACLLSSLLALHVPQLHSCCLLQNPCLTVYFLFDDPCSTKLLLKVFPRSPTFDHCPLPPPPTTTR